MLEPEQLCRNICHLSNRLLERDHPIFPDTVPEHFLHKFFSGLGTPYRAYEAENPETLQKAIDDVNRIERLPIQFTEVLPRRDLSQKCYGAALGCALLLLAFKFVEVRRWA